MGWTGFGKSCCSLFTGRRKFVRPDAAVYNKKDAQQRRLFEKNKGYR